MSPSPSGPEPSPAFATPRLVTDSEVRNWRHITMSMNFVGDAALVRFSELLTGVSALKGTTASSDALLDDADAAVYEAKRAGRDRVVIAG